MKCLVVIAHPLEDSLCKHLAKETIAHLKAKGYEIKVKDLYAENFAPALTHAERQSYFTENFDSSALELDLAQLKETQSLVLIFPTWWFSFPAILKGWFDRVWAPGHAYDHADNNKAILPKLDNLIEMKVITTLGSPRWVDLLVLRQPVRTGSENRNPGYLCAQVPISDAFPLRQRKPEQRKSGSLYRKNQKAVLTNASLFLLIKQSTLD